MADIPLLQFKKTTSAFNYVFERDLKAGETVIVKLPTVSANKRGVNDIGWISNGTVQLSGTFASNPKAESALWQPINDNDEVNKTTAAIKIENKGGACRIEMRAILN